MLDFTFQTCHVTENHTIPCSGLYAAVSSDAVSCPDCHSGGMDFEALGYSGDPMSVGGR